VHGTIEPVLRVEWRPLAELATIAEQWRRLASRALEPNVFYEPAFALAAAPVFGRDVGAGLIWRASELVGVFPARIERRRHGIARPLLVGWTHAYAPLGAPLVDRAESEAVIAAWLDHVVGDPWLPDMVLLPFFPCEGALGRALDAVLARRRGHCRAFAQHRRALLAPAGERASYLDDAIGSKRRKELNRLLKRLSEGGAVSSVSTGDPAAISHAMTEFFNLEAGGWKGRAGTAARDHADIAAFMRAAVDALAAEGKAEISRLCIGERAIAATVTLRSGAAAWCWKIAYDERYARFSPGVQLLRDLTRRLLDDAAVTRADSCATADHPMIDHIWRERLPLADLLILTGSQGAFRFPVACGLESLRRLAIATAKGLRDAARRVRGHASAAKSA
jgi:CelD/BcsL family acetyltransferase involved in cellulose biosynthesis